MSPTQRHPSFTRPGLPPADEYAVPDDTAGSRGPRVLTGLWMAVCFILAACVLLVIAEMVGL